jgi:hypothetical protein
VPPTSKGSTTLYRRSNRKLIIGRDSSAPDGVVQHPATRKIA